MSKTVKDIMSDHIVAVLPSDTVSEAAKLMLEHHIGAVPVVSAGELKGLITDRDIVLRCVAKGKSVEDTKATEIMTTDIAFVTPQQSVKDAADMMASEQVRRLPVLKDGIIDGMVSLADIARKGTDAEVSEAICEISQSNIGPAGAVKTR